jgi:cobalamin synthase
MKKYKSLLDVLIVLILMSLSAAAIVPSKVAMSNGIKTTLIVILFGLVSSFAVLVWREHPADEREAEHQQIASRTAYLAGCGALIVAMLLQAFRHRLDSAIPVALLVMILVKLLVQWHNDKM